MIYFVQNASCGLFGSTSPKLPEKEQDCRAYCPGSDKSSFRLESCTKYREAWIWLVAKEWQTGKHHTEHDDDVYSRRRRRLTADRWSTDEDLVVVAIPEMAPATRNSNYHLVMKHDEIETRTY